MQIKIKIYPLSKRELKVYQRKKIFIQNDVQEKGCDSLYSNTPLKTKTYFRKRFKKKFVSESLEKVPEQVPATVFAIKDTSFRNLRLVPNLNEVSVDPEEFSGFGPTKFGELNNVNGESTELFNLPIVAPSTPKLSDNATCQDQSEEKEETNVKSSKGNGESKFGAENHIATDNLKKRKENNGSDLNKRPQKKLKKKIHRPKIVGEGKPKSTPKPKTPKCTTPKSASLKPRTPKPAATKRVKGKGKNTRSPEDLLTPSEEVEVSVERNDPIVSCRRRLNFDMEKPSEDPHCVLRSGSTQAVNNEANMSSGDFVMNQTGCQYNSIQVYQKRLQINRSSECLDTIIEAWPIPRTCQKRRSMGRRPNKGMCPPTRTVTQSLNDELQSVVKAKGKRVNRLQSESFQRPEAKNDSLFMGGNDGMMPGQNLQLYHKLSEFQSGPSELQHQILSFSNLEENNERTTQSTAEMSLVLPPELLNEQMMIGYFGMEPTFFNLNFQAGTSERSLVEHDFFIANTLSTGPCEERNTLLNQFQYQQTFAQNGDAMVVPSQGFLGEDQSAQIPHYEHGAIVPYGELTEKSQNEKALVPYTKNGTLVPVQGGELSIVKKSRKQVMLEVHSEEIKDWKLQLKDVSKVNNETEGRWENETKVFHTQIAAFIARMRLFLGDRRFSEWKGSVMDSVVGVFLTQNVGDNLSSSAFMSLVAKFRAQSVNHNNQNEVGSQESFESNAETTAPVHHLVSPQLLSSESPKGMVNTENAQQKAQEKTLVDPHSSLSNSFPISDCNFESKSETSKKIWDNKPTSLVDETVQQEGYMQPTDDANRGEEKHEEKQKGINWDEMRRKYCRSDEAKKKENKTDWDELRRKYCGDGQRHSNHKDSLDWEAVRRAKPEEIAEAIKGRGQQCILALRIQRLLDRVVELHGNLDLEWLRHAPPEKIKEYLLEFHGLGLKSVECIRLLALQHVAFPVDTNVGRIAVRLGWVPLEPLPEELQIHLLQQFPVMDSIQKYLWPRLRNLDQKTLYELHYQLITFGKVFCTKRNPSCNACPMRAECKHFASAYASARRALPMPEKNGKASSALIVAVNGPGPSINAVTPSFLEGNLFSESEYQRKDCEPIIEEPASPEPEYAEPVGIDIEDYFHEDSPDFIPTIRLSGGENTTNLECCTHMKNMTLHENEPSRALVALAPEVATYPVPKLKYASRLRTTHQVYVLPDWHPLLIGLDGRDSDDPCPYLLSMWTPGETPKSFQPAEGSNSQEENTGTVFGTILIPCRTANKGSFPLNGTYFQVNELFADHETSERPIDVPRSWLYNLPRRTVYFGTSTSTIFRGLSTEEIQSCFWQGYICVRAFDRKTGGPKPLAPRFHISTSQGGKPKTDRMDDE